MAEIKLNPRIVKIWESLNAPLRILNERGECLLPEYGESITLNGKYGANLTVKQGGDWLRATDTQPVLILAISEKASGAKDLLCMADGLLTSLMKESGNGVSAKDVYRHILRHDLINSEMTDIIRESQLAVDEPRSILLFQLDGKSSAYELLGELLPQSDGDVLLSMGRKQAVLIKNMRNIEGPDELFQFAEAVQETLQEESGLEAIIGIGDEKPNLGSLQRSYQEAQRAIEAGRCFHPKSKIHMYRHLLTERFLLSVPTENLQGYYHILFNEANEKLFTEEMLHTVEMFFEKELNLSDTARALFIHRNTLVYRLDKIQKQTGLDLRHFHDAVAFKLLYELKIADEEKPKQVL